MIKQLSSSGLIAEDKHYQLKNGYIDIRIQDIYQLYAETLQKRRDPNILDKSTLDSYLMSDAKSFIKRHKPFFGGSQKWCLQFKYIELGIDLIKASDPQELKSKYLGMGLPYEENEEVQNNAFPPLQHEKEEDPFSPVEDSKNEIPFPLKGW